MSVPDGHQEFTVKDESGQDTAVRGLTGNIADNMLCTFFKKIITRDDDDLDVDVCVFDVHSPMNVNGYKMHQGDQRTSEYFKLDIREYHKKITEGERRVTELSVSTKIYAVKDIRDAHGLLFPFFRMGNLMSLDIDVHVVRDDRSEIETSDMAHCELISKVLSYQSSY